MKEFNLILVLIVAINLNCSSIKMASKHQQDSEIIYNFIQDSLISYSLLETKQLNDTTTWLKNYISNSYSCMSDFDGDGNMDYSFLIKNNTSNKLFLFCFFLIDNNIEYCKVDSFRVANDSNPEISVSVYPKGDWEAIDEKIRVTNNGILVEDLYESLSFAYYHKDGKFYKFFFD